MKSRLVTWLSFGSIGAAFLASCCAVPLTLIFLGIGAGGLSVSLAAYRWIFLTLTFLLLGFAFYLVYGRKKPLLDEPSVSCDRRSKDLTKLLLWGATALALVFLLGPFIFVWISRR